MGKMNKWGQILSSQSRALGNYAKRAKKADNAKNDWAAAFDIFPDWAKSAIADNALSKDKQTVEQKDDYKTGVENYMARKRAHRKITPTEYNDYSYTVKTPFSSPDTDQSQVEPTNIGGYEEVEDTSVSYDDPVISTKDTPTSIKRGIARPGPSTFIQTARYNPQTKQLNVQYTDGTIFPYHDVSPELADAILKKKNYHSPGQTMLATIFKGHGTTRADMIDDIEEGM